MLLFASLFASAQSVQQLMSKAKALRFTNPDSAELLIKEIIPKLNPKKDEYLLARTYNMYGNVQYVRGEAEKSDSCYRKALVYAEKCKNDSVQIFILNNIGQLYYGYGTLEEAVSYYERALKKAGQAKLSLLIADTYNNLGTIYMAYGMNKKSVEYFEKGIEAYKKDTTSKVESEIVIGDISNNIANAYFAEGKFDLATQYYFSALKAPSGQLM